MFEMSERARDYHQRVTAFMEEHVYPIEDAFYEQIADGDRWQVPPLMEELKEKARAAGLWNLFLPDEKFGPGLSNVEYAPLAEIMGAVWWASEVFNCSAPDTGNMEILAEFGTPEQQDRWLQPLLEGEIRSCFAMTGNIVSFKVHPSPPSLISFRNRGFSRVIRSRHRT